MILNSDVSPFGSGARSMAYLVFWQELLLMIYDMRLPILVTLLLIAADFRYGRGESAVRYAKAKKQGDTAGMEAHRWRTSRALRRSINKLLDYFVFLCLGRLIGEIAAAAMDMPDLGMDGAYIAIGIAILIEGQSIASHFLYLHVQGINTDRLQSLIAKFLVRLVKIKHPKAGEALEETLESEKDN